MPAKTASNGASAPDTVVDLTQVVPNAPTAINPDAVRRVPPAVMPTLEVRGTTYTMRSLWDLDWDDEADIEGMAPRLRAMDEFFSNRQFRAKLDPAMRAEFHDLACSFARIAYPEVEAEHGVEAWNDLTPSELKNVMEAFTSHYSAARRRLIGRPEPSPKPIATT